MRGNKEEGGKRKEGGKKKKGVGAFSMNHLLRLNGALSGG